MDCLFCLIVRGELSATRVLETDDAVVIRDVNPQAPVHLLVVSRQHIPDVAELAEVDPGMLGRLMVTATQAAESEGIATTGYRLVVNTGADGGQTVLHLHIHVLGGREMSWPPG